MRSARQKSILQEEGAAELIGGKRRRGSGSVAGLPGDAVSEGFFVECKYTHKKSISIAKRDLSKLEEDAISANKVPVLVFGFANGDRVKNNWVAVPWYLFEVVKDELERR